MRIKILAERLYFNKEILLHKKEQMCTVFRSFLFLAFFICFLYPIILFITGNLFFSMFHIILSLLPLLVCIVTDFVIKAKKNNTAWFLTFIILPVTILIRFNYFTLPGLQLFTIPLAIACFFIIKKHKQVFWGYLICFLCFSEMFMLNEFRENKNFIKDLPFLSIACLLFGFTLFYTLLYTRNLIDNYHVERKKNLENLALANELLLQKNTTISEQLNVLIYQNELILNSASFQRKVVSIMSHDAKMAIVPIKYLLSGYRKNILSPEKLENYVCQIEQEIDKANKLFDDILTLSYRQNDMLINITEKVNLHDLVIEVSNELKMFCEEKKINLKIKIHSKFCIYTNSGILKIIIRNILSNAIKFSHSFGEIEIYNEKGSDLFEKICIADKGVGISKAKILEIMNEFVMKEEILNSNTEGLGIGLRLTKNFIEELGGEFFIENRSTGGTLLSFTIPNEKQKIAM